MPNTCCSAAPSRGRTCRATSGLRGAPPTCTQRRDGNGVCGLPSRARSHTCSSAGTSAVCVTPCAAISGNAVPGAASGATTTRPPACSAPSVPGDVSGKLCASGSAARYTVSAPSSHRSALARMEYR